MPAPSWTVVLRIWEELCSHQPRELSSNGIPFFPFDPASEKEVAKLLAEKDQRIVEAMMIGPEIESPVEETAQVDKRLPHPSSLCEAELDGRRTLGIWT